MQRLSENISYSIAKTSFGIYLVDELRSQGGKEKPTETDVKKILQRINPNCTATELQTARQISRYCQTNKDYLRDAREETLDKVARAIKAPVKSFVDFRDKINPLLKSFKYYKAYVDRAEDYLDSLSNGGTDNRNKFGELFVCVDQTVVLLSMISYNFGLVDPELPALSFGAESDLRTERIIRSLFEKFAQPVPQYLPENTFFAQLMAPMAKTTFVAVGLFGNRLTNWMASTNRLPSMLEILPAEKCIRFDGRQYVADRMTGIDYAIFCRIILSEAATVIIIGGIEGFGTQRMGEYMEDNWHQLQQQIDHTKCSVLLYKTTEVNVEQVGCLLV